MFELGDQTHCVFALEDRAVEGGAIRNASVSTTLAKRNPLGCPVCGGGNVLIEGQFRREFSEEFVNGVSLGYETDPDTEKNVLAVLCSDCKVRYVIEPDVVFELREEILQLTMALANQVGLAVIPSATDLAC